MFTKLHYYWLALTSPIIARWVVHEHFSQLWRIKQNSSVSVELRDIWERMSHQTGIKANDALKKVFAKCRDGKIRVLKVSIENEELVPASSSKPVGKWQDDYDKMVKPLIVENQPAYILYRLDSKSPDSGYDWLFISWSPDIAPIRQKMLYASTKATLKQEFGTASIKEELHGTVLEDITLEGYRRHKRNDAAPAPLTTAEEELAELKKTTINTDYSVETRHQTLSGVAFPVTDEAKQAITDLGKGLHEYVQLKIDLEEEKIHLVMACEVSLDKLPTKVPSDAARYHLYNFKHTHEGDYIESIVFIYSMPGYSCSIKERMLYSSCKAPLLDLIQSLGVNITKKLEVNSGDELADMLEDPPTIKETAATTSATPSTPSAPIQSMPEKKSKQKRSCVLS